MTYRLGLANVQNTPDISRARVKKCGEIAGKAAHVIFFNEIREGEDVNDIQAGLGRGFTLANVSCPNPIAFRKDTFRFTPNRELPPGFQNRGLIKLHAGSSKLPTPARYLSWVILSPVARPNVDPSVWVGVHLINKAFNGKENDPGQERIRRQLWWEGFDETQWCVNNFRKFGLPVIWGGDWNRRSLPKFNEAQQHVTSNHGIMKSFCANGNHKRTVLVKAVPTARKTIKIPSDKALYVGGVSLSVKR